jgi:hypothetical protein
VRDDVFDQARPLQLGIRHGKRVSQRIVPSTEEVLKSLVEFPMNGHGPLWHETLQTRPLERRSLVCMNCHPIDRGRLSCEALRW